MLQKRPLNSNKGGLQMSYEFKYLRCELKNKIMLIVIERQEVLNALNSEVFKELGDVFMQMKDDPEVDVVILTGAGDKSFIAGSDVAEMSQCSLLEAREFVRKVYDAQQKIASFPRPTIAAINGFAFGGGLEVAMCCDIRVASEKAKFGQPEVNVGIIPGGGGTQRLTRLIGAGRAKEMIFTCMTIGAQKAYEIGLVNRVVNHECLIEESMKLAEEIAKKSNVMLTLAKSAVDIGADLDLENALRTEMELFVQCFATVDGKEGLVAFVEKRKANFIGK
jgi:enoyl-CoA hydratase